MRSALLACLLLLTGAVPAAHGDTEDDTVTLLVPRGSQGYGLQAQSGSSAGLPWERIAVPVVGSVDETVERVGREMGVVAYPDVAYPLLGGEDEPRFANQWALENTGQQGGTVDADIDATEAWPVTTGDGALVAVIDSGVESSHPELEDQLWRNDDEMLNGLDDDGNGFVDDVEGWDFESWDNDPDPIDTTPDEAHATFIAGIIAAEVNGQGIAGVAPDAEVMNLRACREGTCLTFDAVAAIHYAVDNGADIINLSFGGPAEEIDLDNPLAQAIEYARQEDVLVVTAAGNTAPEDLNPGEVIVPAEYPHANNVSVAATDRDDAIGEASYYGDNIDIAAPGYEIFSTSLPSYAIGSGSSYSAPHVAGVAALVRSLDPDMGYEDVVSRLKNSADEPSDIVGKVESGRLNAANALPVFVDILGNTFELDIEWLAESGITKGCNPPANTLYCPDDTVTRGQMAAFIARFLGLPATGQDSFTDDNGSTFEGDINRLAEAGITKGCNPPANDRFCPDDAVTREQMAAFLVRALSLSDMDHPGFEDVPADTTFHGDIARLATAGITRGCNPPANSLFCPEQEVTRGQMAAFLHRAGA